MFPILQFLYTLLVTYSGTIIISIAFGIAIGMWIEAKREKDKEKRKIHL